MSNAISNHYFGASIGPPGTGKTETIKDLAASLLRRSIIVNGCDNFSVQAMANIFKGTAMVGAWTIVDEFVKIKPTLMAAIAQMLQVVRFASQNHATSITIETESVRLKAGSAVFITSNILDEK